MPRRPWLFRRPWFRIDRIATFEYFRSLFRPKPLLRGVDPIRLHAEQLEGRDMLSVSLTLFPTGVNPSGSALADNQTDPHYQLINPTGTDLMPGPARTIVSDGYPIGPWVGNTSTSRWIVPTATNADGNGGVGNYDYRTTFDLSSIDPSTVQITGLWAADNNATIYLNGVSTGITVGEADFRSLTPFTLSSGFRVGTNDLDFVVHNAGGPTGLRVASLSGTGESGPVAAASQIIYPTGVDASGGLLAASTTPAVTGLNSSGAALSDLATDTHFTITSAPSGYIGGTKVRTPSGGFPFPHWDGSTDVAGSAWIVPAASDNAGDAPPGEYTFTTTVNVTDPTNLVLSGKWAADNSATIYVNGTNTGVSVPGFGTMTPFTLTGSYFTAGTNTIEFRVTNGGTSPNPTGLRVAWDAVASTIDPHWTVVSAPNSSLVGPTKVVPPNAYPLPPWVADDDDSQWIAPLASSANASAPVGTYVFQTTFDLTGYDPSTAVLSGQWSADNSGVDVYLNGVSLGLTRTGPNSGSGVQGYLAYSDLYIANGVGGAEFVSGVNTLQFVVHNDSLSEGSTTPNPVGLRVDDLRLYTQAAAIGDQVFYDTNGNGVQDSGEGGAGGVSVTLTGGSLASPRTTVTDPAGHYTFAGLAAGDYAVEFTAADGYAFSTPSAGTAFVHLSTSQIDNTVDAGLVRTGSTKTVLASDANPVAYGQPVTFTATVTDTVSAASIPTGGVLFIVDGGAPYAANLDTSGVATFTRSDLSPGVHAVSVTYQGNERFTLSTSSQLNEVVNRAFTTTVVPPDAGGAVAGQTTSLEATVTVVAPGAGIPTGTVTFYDGAVPLGTSTLSESGIAKLDATNLVSGSHTITAVYGGDTNYGDSSSDESPLSVSAATSTAFSTTADTATFGQSVTFTATVTADSGTPTGSVTFSDGDTVLGTATLDGEGKATFTTAALAVGYHSVQASYGGDSGFGPSQTSGDQTINPAETQTQLAAAWDTGGSATLTVTVSAGTGSGTPTGTVTFSDLASDTVLGTGTLDAAGQATLTLSLPGPAYDILASYAGDTSFNPSSSVNTPPTAPDSSIRTDVGIPQAVSAGFTDLDSDQLEVTLTQPTDGSVVYVGQDSFTYTPPDATWTGVTSFNYTVRDGRGGVATGTIHVRVSDPNTLAADLSATTSPKKPVVITTSFDAQSITMTGFTQGTNGTVSFADGAFTYTPTSLDWTGTDTFEYTLTDGTRTDTGIVTVTVTPWPTLIVTPTSDPSPADPNQTITFSATATGGSGTGYTYEWDFGDNSDNVAAATTTHDYSEPGIYPAFLTVTDDVGNTSTVPVDVTVRDVVTVTGFGSVAEGAPPTAFTFTRTGTVGDLVVSYTVGGNPAATPGADYQAFDGIVTIPDGSNSVTLPFTTLRDNLVEGDEVVELTVTDGSGYTVGTANTASITITDDPPIVTVAGTSNASEAGPTAGLFTFTRVGGDPATSLTVRYTLGGSATEGSDYNALSGWVTFPSGQTTITLDVTPRTDALVEGDETVEVTVDPGDGSTYLPGDAKTASMIIADSPPMVRLAATSADETPDALLNLPVSGVFEVSRTGGDYYAPVTVPVSFGGTATPGVDYTVALAVDSSDPGIEYPNLPTSVLIPAATSAVYLRVIPKRDNVVELGGETVVLTAGVSQEYVTDSSNPATLTIADDPPVVNVDYWNPGVTSALEGSTGDIRFHRSGGDPSQPLTATYTIAGTATAGTDYQALSRTVTFPAGVTDQRVPIVTLTDGLAEGPETVVVTVNDGGASYRAGGQSVTFTIDDDSPVVSIQKIVDAAEPSVAGSFQISRQGGNTSVPLTVYLHTVLSGDHPATEGVDYQTLPTEIEFGPNELEKTIPVIPISDDLNEGDETVTLALSDGGYQSDESSATVTIADNNSNFFFSVDPTSVDEGTEFILSGSYTPTTMLAAGSYQLSIDWRDGTTPFTKLYTFDSPQTQVQFSAAHAYADDGIVSSNPVPQAGNETPSDDQPMVVTLTSVADPASTVHGTATVTVKNVLPTDAKLQVEVNPKDEPGLPRTADDPRGVLVRLSVNVTDPGVNDLHRAVIDWGDHTTTDVPYSRPGSISVYHTYEVGAEPGEIPGKRTYSIAAEIWDDDSTQPEDAATATTTVEIDEQAPALTIDGFVPAPVNEGSAVTLTGTLRNPGSAGTSGWQQVEINWGDGTPLEHVDLFAWANRADFQLGNPTSPSYSSALGFQATHTYKNDKPWNGQGTQPGYAVTATVVDVNHTEPLEASGTAVVNNVAPSNLKIQFIEFPSDVPTANSHDISKLRVEFKDTGVLDPHTVTVNWGDGESSTFHVPAGTSGSYTLDPNDDQWLLQHTYHTLPLLGITVTVTDDGPAGVNAISAKIALKVLNEPQVLSGYYSEAQKVNSGTVVEEIIAFGNHLYDLVASKARAFTDAVGDFVNQLQELEKTLRDLFSNSAPAFLDGLLSDPVGFSNNLMQAAEQGFTRFFNNFTGNVQEIVLNWVKNKIPDTLAVTAADLPNLEPEAVAGFALKLMGLTRDDFIARMASAIGPDNAQLLVQAYDYVQTLLASNDETAFINGLTRVFDTALNALGNGGTVGNLLDDLNFETIKSDAISAIRTQVLSWLGPQVAVLAASYINPGVGSFKTLFKAGQWLVNNVQAVRGAVGVINTLAQQVNEIKAGNTGQVATEIERALKALSTVGLDLAAQITGFNDIPTRVFTAIESLKSRIKAPIDRVLDTVVSAVKAQLNRILGSSTDYTGLIGNVITFKVGSETHRLWAVASSGNGPNQRARFMLASTPDDLNKSVMNWQTQARTDMTMQQLVNKEVAAQAAVTVKLTAVDAALAKYKSDQMGQGMGTPRQIATQNAKLTTDFKAVGTTGKDLVTAEGQTDQTAPTPRSDLVRTVADCMGRACFVAGTPLRTPNGSKPIETVAVGDTILSRSEFDPNGPVEVKVVEEVFIRTGRVLNLHVGGQVIGTTFEHPFFEAGRGWVSAGELHKGDRIATLTGEWVTVEEVFDTGCAAAVYNLRVADHHTYFVGTDEWGFSVWAHNAYTVEHVQGGAWTVINESARPAGLRIDRVVRDVAGNTDKFDTAEIAQKVRNDQEQRETRALSAAGNAGDLYEQRVRRSRGTSVIRFAEGVYNHSDGGNWQEYDFETSGQLFESGINLAGKVDQIIRYAITARARHEGATVIFGPNTARDALHDIATILRMPFSDPRVQAQMPNGVQLFSDNIQVISYLTFHAELQGFPNPADGTLNVWPDDWEAV